MADSRLLQTPRRFLFIVSIGNIQPPYRFTRHSAGHVLLDALLPLLDSRALFNSTPLPSTPTCPSAPVFYKTWYSQAYMNESGPSVVRKLREWTATRKDLFAHFQRHRGEIEIEREPARPGTPTGKCAGSHTSRPPFRRFQQTLVILHDEMEAPLGMLRVRRGGPEASSLRGHRGLISVMDSLRKKGLYLPPSPPAGSDDQSKGRSGSRSSEGGAGTSGLSILRVGVGIGRPRTHERDEVADYVLTKMSDDEVKAVRAAAHPVVELLVQELYRDDWEGSA